MTEQELVDECIAGKSIAQEKLFKIYSGKLFAIAIRYMGSREEAEDVLQEGFIKIFKNLNQWKGDGPLGGWMRRVIVNTALTQLKSRIKKQQEIAIDTAYAVHDNQESQLEKLQADDLLKVIAEMPTGYRTVFNLFAIEGYGHKEISEQLGINESTSKTQYLKAKNWLLKRIDER
jgi:RNA polymerase sigma factor (sigma-70 family)